MPMSAKFLVVLSLAFSLPARAEIPVYAVDADLAVAIELADLKAERGAQAINRCMAYFANEGTCNRVNDGTGRWQCRAAYSKHRGSCAKGRQTIQSIISDTIENLNQLCGNGREAACAAAAGG